MRKHSGTRRRARRRSRGELRAPRLAKRNLSVRTNHCPTQGRGAVEFHLSVDVLREIYLTVGAMPAEQGGLLGGSRKSGEVTHFVFDESARRTGSAYSPDHDRLNKVLAQDWNPAGVNLLGFVHSHPKGIRYLSGADVEYGERILAAIPELERLFLPIVQSESQGGSFELLPFVVHKRGHRTRVEVASLVVASHDGSMTRVRGPEDLRLLLSLERRWSRVIACTVSSVSRIIYGNVRPVRQRPWRPLI